MFLKLFKVTSLLVLALTGAAFVQAASPGTVVVNQVLLGLDAVAGEENCHFLGPVEQNIIVVCFVDDNERELHDYRPIPGGPALTGDFTDANNRITWSLRRNADGKFLFEIHANGTVQSGQF